MFYYCFLISNNCFLISTTKIVHEISSFRKQFKLYFHDYKLKIKSWLATYIWVHLMYIECGLHLSAVYIWVRLSFECSLDKVQFTSSAAYIWVRPTLKSSLQSAAYNLENTVWIACKMRKSHEQFTFYWLKSNWYWSKSNEKTKCERNVFDTNAISW